MIFSYLKGLLNLKSTCRQYLGSRDLYVDGNKASIDIVTGIMHENARLKEQVEKLKRINAALRDVPPACDGQEHHQFAPKMLKTEVVGDELIITIHRDYLVNSVEHGITTGLTSKVIDKNQCLHHYAKAFVAFEEDSAFNKTIDLIARDAYENGERWLVCDSVERSTVEHHLWNDSGDQCVKCGDKDWYAGGECKVDQSTLLSK